MSCWINYCTKSSLASLQQIIVGVLYTRARARTVHTPQLTQQTSQLTQQTSQRIINNSFNNLFCNSDRNLFNKFHNNFCNSSHVNFVNGITVRNLALCSTVFSHRSCGTACGIMPCECERFQISINIVYMGHMIISYCAQHCKATNKPCIQKYHMKTYA